MPFRERQIDVDMHPAADREPQPARRSLKPVRLVLRLQHEAAHEWDRSVFPLPHPTSIDFQDGQRDLECARDVLLVHLVLVGERSVRGPLKPELGPQILAECDPNRLVHDESELREQSTEGRRQFSGREAEAAYDARAHSCALGVRRLEEYGERDG